MSSSLNQHNKDLYPCNLSGFQCILAWYSLALDVHNNGLGCLVLAIHPCWPLFYIMCCGRYGSVPGSVTVARHKRTYKRCVRQGCHLSPVDSTLRPSLRLSDDVRGSARHRDSYLHGKHLPPFANLHTELLTSSQIICHCNIYCQWHDRDLRSWLHPMVLMVFYTSW